MSDQPKKFYLTTPIYYVNARPHIGHAYTTIAADVLARRHRLLGEDVFFLTGTDEHGQKIERSAAAAGIPPQQFADEVAASFAALWKRMGITNDKFIRTTSEEHKRGVQRLWRELESRGAIYLDSYTGAYCVSDETFVDQPAGTPCPDCGRPLEIVTEENYFFRLSQYQEKLIELIEAGQLIVEPETRRNEVLSFVRGGLKDLSISRTSFQWGIPVPTSNDAVIPSERSESRDLRISSAEENSSGAPSVPESHPGTGGKEQSSPGAPFIERSEMSGKEQNHVIYVWLDALTNYMSAVGYGADTDASLTAQQREAAAARFAKYWPADLHLVGKEIIRFHCVYWPAFLLAAGLPLPKKIQAHGWLLFEESKMSKSRGNIVRTETILDAFGDHYRASLAAHNAKLAADHTKAATASQDVLLKGTASAVPSDATKSTGALAPEVAPFLPEPTKEDCDLFAADVLRYFLLREIPFGQDGSFSFDALITRYNADLANGYGNLVSRTLNMVEKYFGGKIPEIGPDLAEEISGYRRMQETANFESGFTNTLIGHLDRNEFDRFLQGMSVQVIGVVDQSITYMAPWKEKDTEANTDKARRFALYYAAESVRIITALLHPVMPHTTAKVWAQLGLDPADLASTQPTTNNQQLATLSWGGLKPGTKLGPLAPIFPRAPKELAQVMSDMEAQNNPATPKYGDSSPTAQNDKGSGGDTAAPALSTANGADTATPSPQSPVTSPLITIDDFAKVDLRVARVLVAERIPKADKLLRLEVDLGYEKRQILAGIAQYYEPEKLIGRKVVIVANLAPRKMRGLESQGMVVAASIEPGGAPALAGFLEDVEIGARLR